MDLTAKSFIANKRLIIILHPYYNMVLICLAYMLKIVQHKNKQHFNRL